MNILRIMMNKDAFFCGNEPFESCLSLFVSEEMLGTTRIRKGTLGSLPSGLLTPTVPCWIVY